MTLPHAVMPETLVVRQPVFDRNKIVVGFELRYRETDVGSDAFTRAFLSPSFDALRSGLPTYVRCTRRQLQAGVFEALDPRTVVLLVPSHMELAPRLRDSIASLAESGVLLGIDEFPVARPAHTPGMQLLQLARIVRFDMRSLDPDPRERERLAVTAATLRQQGKRLIADHVMDAQTHEECLKLGFDTFQGPYFGHPSALSVIEVPVDPTAALWLLTLARQPSTPRRELERVLRSDPGLVFRLARMAGTRPVGGPYSIAGLIDAVGRERLARWLALTSAQLAQPNDPEPDRDLLGKSVFRAHFCEALGVSGSGLDRGTLYLIGLFSLADALFRIPLQDVLTRMNASDDVRSALLNRAGPYADALHVIEAYELSLWETAADAAMRLGIGPNYLPSLYSQALRWAMEYLPTGLAPRRLSRAG